MSRPPRIDIANLRQASRDCIIRTLAGFVGQPVERWLPSTHPASIGQLLAEDGSPCRNFAQFRQNFTDAQAVEALAATGPSHCIDGWTFFSRAVSSLLSGDTHTSRHLAYYAQLRAALCLLHCHGIGVFNGVNFAIDDSGGLRPIEDRDETQTGLSTHRAAWHLLREWAGGSQAACEFLTAVEFRGISLADCIDAVWPSALQEPLVSDVVEAWGIDLQRSSEDQELRNISSYCAQAFNQVESRLPDRLELVHQIWLALEPGGGGGYAELDRHLLRRFFERMGTTQLDVFQNGVDWREAHENLDPQIADFVRLEFLTRVWEPDDLVVFSHADSRHPGDVHGMICRALLLLRTATAVVRRCFLDADFNPLAEHVPLWFASVGVDRGFWSSGVDEESVEALWGVVGNAVNDLSARRPGYWIDQFSFLDEMKSQSVLLSQTERACMWGVSI